MVHYRSIRSDFHSHRRTRGLSPLARDLMLQAIEANIAGILERSPKGLARVAGGHTNTEQVEDALAQLQKRELATWWPDLETLWVHEAADEQARNPSAEKAVRSVVDNAPAEIREAFDARYGRGYGREPNTLSDTLSTQSTGSESGIRVQDQGAVGERAPLRLLPHTWISEFRPVLMATEAARKLQISPFGGQQCADAVGRALTEYGRDRVEQVVLWTAEQAVKGTVNKRYYARMFHGDGFGARLTAFLEAQETREELEGAEDPAEYIERLRAQRAAEDAEHSGGTPWS